MIIVVLILLLVVNNAIDKRILYPAFIFNLLWIVIIGLHDFVTFFNLFEIDKLGFQTKIYIFFAVFSFSIGNVLIKYTFSRFIKISSFDSNLILDKYCFRSRILMFFSLIGLILFINKAILIANLTPSFPFFESLRFQLNYNNQSYGLVGYFVTLGIFNATYRLLRFQLNKNNNKKDKFKLILSFIIAILFCLFSTGRTYFLLLIIISVGIIMMNKVISLKKIFLTGFVIILVFALMGLLLNKGGNFDNNISQNIKLMSKSFAVYLIGPVTAFDKSYLSTNSGIFGEHIFRFFYILFHKIGMSNAELPSLVQPYTNIPFEINVYTIFDPYYKDFGIAGSYVFIFFFGLFNSIIFELSGSGRIYYKYFTAILLYPLIMSFFQDQYFALLSTWLQFLILSLIFFPKIIIKK